MAYLGDNQPDIIKTLANGNVIPSGQVIKFSEGVAVSGKADATLGPALVVVDPDTGEEKLWLYANGSIGFGAVDDRTSFRDNSGVQIDAYFGNNRIFYYNGNGINLAEKRLDGRRRAVSRRSADFTPNSQDTSQINNNSLATGLITGTISQLVSGGHQYTFVRTADFPFRILPNSEAILTPTGLLPVGNYIELASHGASVTLVADVGGTWMITNQTGTVNPQP